MKKQTVMVTGVFGILLVAGVAVALAQNITTDRAGAAENHECTPEMMKNMTENCPEQMMQSGACENMMNGSKNCNEIMGRSSRSAGTGNEKTGHCGDMDSEMGSMMGSSSANMGKMM